MSITNPCDIEGLKTLVRNSQCQNVPVATLSDIKNPREPTNKDALLWLPEGTTLCDVCQLTPSPIAGYSFISPPMQRIFAPTSIVNSSQSSAFGLFVLLWMVAGLVAFIWSITCFFGHKRGTIGENVLGLILALLLGPIWFLFVYAMHQSGSGYCKKRY